MKSATIRTWLVAGLGMLCLLPAWTLANAPFHDVLDTPSAKSTLAAKGLLVGVTMAGNRIVGVGWHGHIVYSPDRGKSWTQATVPVSSDLVAVHFPTPSKGWAVGHDGVVLHTSDGGRNWIKQFDGRAAAALMAQTYGGKPEFAGMADDIRKFEVQGPDKPFLDVYFENETTGFVVGAFSLIFRTTDGGKSWTPWYDRIDNPKRFHLYSIRPIGDELYLTAEQGTVFKMNREKDHFTMIKTPYVGTFFGITGKPGSLVAFGMRGNAFRSTDGGANWQKVETGVQGGLMGAAVTEDGRITLVSQGGHVIVSSDDGASFTQLEIDQPTPAAGITAVDRTTIALAGHRGVQVRTIK